MDPTLNGRGADSGGDMPNPDLDKYLERLVADADSYLASKPQGASWSELGTLATGFGSLITAICAVLREQREAKKTAITCAQAALAESQRNALGLGVSPDD